MVKAKSLLIVCETINVFLINGKNAYILIALLFCIISCII